MKNPRFLLAIICIVFLITRLYKISEIPPSVYWDEASIGYNAFSLAQTGQDEWGDSFPLHFRAFGEFKLPVYIYATVLSVKIFGINEFSIRIPAVLFSLGVVILTYLLAKKLSDSNMVGLFSSLFITISPWFFIFSRTGFEVTAGLMFYLLGIYLFLLHSKNGIFIFLSIISFILSAYSYNSFRIIVPLTMLILIWLERDNLMQVVRKQFRWIILSLILVAVATWPIYRLYTYDVGLFRLQAVGSVDMEQFFKNYTSHFSLDFLLFGDKNLRHQQQDFGQIYLPELILLILGLIFLFKNNTKYRWLPVILILLAPIPASLTRESPHALRALSIVPFISMISAMGAASLRSHLNIGIVLLMLAFFINYFINFVNIYPTLSAKEWQYGYKKIFTDKSLNEKDKILVSEKDGQPYIFALFYLKYDPNKFRNEVVRNPVDKWGFSTVKSFGKFEFGDTNE